MDASYTVRAKRDPSRDGGLTIAYPSKELALAAAEVIRDLWAFVTITGPDGVLVTSSASGEARDANH
jgi:hypothetical protein